MSKVIFSDIDLLIDERNKEIIINPKGERFYGVECDAMDSVFTDAVVSLSEEGVYEIEGKQILYREHKDRGRNFKNLLCLHPEALIKRHMFLGLFEWYSVSGVMKREVINRYVCLHKEYRFFERLKFLSHECIEKV